MRGAGGYQMFGITPMPIYDPKQEISYLARLHVPVQSGRHRQMEGRSSATNTIAIVADVEAGKFAPSMANVDFSLDAFHADIDGTNAKLMEALHGH